MIRWFAALCLAACACCQALSAQPLYTLVAGVDQFEGSSAAWGLLQTNGFVVAEPSFNDFSEAYASSPLPVFITPDSAWDAYVRIVQFGLNRARLAEAPRLAAFSHQLWSAARAKSQSEGPDFAVLASYAAIGLGLQDENFADDLPKGEKHIIEALRAGAGTVEPGLGGALAAAAFRAPAQIAGDNQLAGCFAARQWYGTVVFRLSDARETRLALDLAWLIQSDPALFQAWGALTARDEALCGPATDGDVVNYLAIAKGFDPSDPHQPLESWRNALQKKLPDPQVNDQFLPADDKTHFASLIKGFRLLPPRPWLNDLHATNEFTNSLAGQSLALLSHLRDPLPNSAPPALRTPAWLDLQRWTALGAWADWPRTWDLPGKTNAETKEPDSRPPGVVAPYPHFFAGLAQACRRAASALHDPAFDTLAHDYAVVCDRLAELAKKQLAAIALNADDLRWIRDYGATLQKFHLSSETDASDFPVIARLSSDPTDDQSAYTWDAPPEALYIILPTAARVQLYRGAIFSFRHAARPASAVGPGAEPPAPPDFTRAFRAKKTLTDLFSDLADDTRERDPDMPAIVQELQNRIADSDVPDLIRLLAGLEEPSTAYAISLAGLMGKMNWKPWQANLLHVMETNEAALPSIAAILQDHPEAVDADYLCANFARQPAAARVVYCRLLRKQNPTPEIAALLCRATRDENEDVRWCAILGVRELQLTNSAAREALLKCASDTNAYVAAAAIRALSKLNLRDTAPLLLDLLQQRRALPAPAPHPMDEAVVARRMLLTGEDPDDLEQRSILISQRAPALLRRGEIGAAPQDELAQALGHFQYPPATELLFSLLDGPFAASAVKALDQLAPERIRNQLLDTACDMKRPAAERDVALRLLMQTAPSSATARRLAPLLDDNTEVELDQANRPGSRRFVWKVSDRAASTVAHLLGKTPPRFNPVFAAPANAGPEQARQWLKEAAP